MSIPDGTPAPADGGGEQHVVRQRRLASVALTACGVTTVLVISRLDAWGGWNQIEVRGDGTPFLMAVLAASFCVLAVVSLIATLALIGRLTPRGTALSELRWIRRLNWSSLVLCWFSVMCLWRAAHLMAGD